MICKNTIFKKQLTIEVNWFLRRRKLRFSRQIRFLSSTANNLIYKNRWGRLLRTVGLRWELEELDKCNWRLQQSKYLHMWTSPFHNTFIPQVKIFDVLYIFRNGVSRKLFLCFFTPPHSASTVEKDHSSKSWSSSFCSSNRQSMSARSQTSEEGGLWKTWILNAYIFE